MSTQLICVAIMYKEPASIMFLDQRIFAINDAEDFGRQMVELRAEIEGKGMNIANTIATPIEVNGEYKIGFGKRDI